MSRIKTTWRKTWISTVHLQRWMDKDLKKRIKKYQPSPKRKTHLIWTVLHISECHPTWTLTWAKYFLKTSWQSKVREWWTIRWAACANCWNTTRALLKSAVTWRRSQERLSKRENTKLYTTFKPKLLPKERAIKMLYTRSEFVLRADLFVQLWQTMSSSKSVIMTKLTETSVCGEFSTQMESCWRRPTLKETKWFVEAC